LTDSSLFIAEGRPLLQKTAASYLERSDEERIRYIKGSRWVSYDAAQKILVRLEDLLQYPKSHRMPNLLIVGETNSGKTLLAKYFCKRHPPQNDPEREAANIPVMYIQAPIVPDEGRFYNAILDLLFAPYKPSDRADRKQAQAIKLLRAVGLKILIIDEIQHILAGAMAKQRIFLNLIKYLGNELQIPIVCIGVREAFRAIQTDPQLSNRFRVVTLSPWKYGEPFQDLLRTFESTLPLHHPSYLEEEALANKILALTDGYIGEISGLLVSAAEHAIKTGHERIDKKILDQIDWIPPAERRTEPADI